MNAAVSALPIDTALRQTPLFAAWPPAVLSTLAAAGRSLHCTRRTALLRSRQRRELLVVVSGLVEISRTSEDGRKHLLGFLGAGAVAPLVRLLEDVPLGYDYHAHAAADVVVLPCSAMFAVLADEPILWRDIALLGLRRQRDSIAALHEQALGSTRRRIAGTLLTLARDTGTPLRDGAVLRIGLTQTDLATMLGLSRQTLNKALRELAGEGVVEAVYRRVTLLDVGALERIARGP